MPRELAEPGEERQRLAKQKRHREQRRRNRGERERERGPRRVDSVPPPPPPATRRLRNKVRAAHGDYGGEQRESEYADADEQPDRRVRNRERRRRIPAKRPMNRVQRDCEHAEEYGVFAVEKRMGVDAWMEQKNQRGEQRERAAVEHAPRQQPDESAAAD